MSPTAIDRTPHIAEMLIRDILAGHYQPGDFIPRELDLCQRFELSRNVVRRQLSMLVDGGIIERIAGHGSRVLNWQSWNILDPMVTDWIARFAAPNQAILQEILSFRLSVEPFVAMTAAQQATAHDLVAIEEAWNALSGDFHALSDDTPRHLPSDHDVAFHVAIYRATHNVVWSRLSHVLRPSIQLVVVESNTSTRNPGESLESHRRLMDSIRMRQPHQAFEAAREVLHGTAMALGLDDAQTPVPHDMARAWMMSTSG
ncbi:GntR family transcriptional regulator [Kushneria sinocarnis]|uniref:GntR family transcriptional regulator n=1 Tax=Kushneria sinocarnis TaxID=595502 RepID=A0A420WZU8_9GAMM|nr:FCD domain-containing protein [Kushneria sinocarnis]RKR06780.1 GntR family transcriptional regulator [Kushneria sinocarnis]